VSILSVLHKEYLGGGVQIAAGLGECVQRTLAIVGEAHFEQFVNLEFGRGTRNIIVTPGKHLTTPIHITAPVTLRPINGPT
jgi:hypothetical protein